MKQKRSKSQLDRGIKYLIKRTYEERLPNSLNTKQKESRILKTNRDNQFYYSFQNKFSYSTIVDEEKQRQQKIIRFNTGKDQVDYSDIVFAKKLPKTNKQQHNETLLFQLPSPFRSVKTETSEDNYSNNVFLPSQLEQKMENSRIQVPKIRLTRRMTQINQEWVPKKQTIRKNSVYFIKNDQKYQKLFKKISQQQKEISVHNIKLLKDQIKVYFQETYSSKICDKVINTFFTQFQFLAFMECPPIMNYQSFLQFLNKLFNLKLVEINFLSYLLIDQNQDGLLCAKDIFNLLKIGDKVPSAMQDFQKIGHWVAQQNGYKKINYLLLIFRFPQDTLVMKDLFGIKNLNLSLFQRYVQSEGQINYISNAKKITVYHLSFFVLEHQQKERQFNEIKQEAIKVEQKVEKEDKKIFEMLYKDTSRFRINFQTFSQIFGDQASRISIEIINKLILQE